MQNPIHLTPSWILTTDHPNSRYGIPVLIGPGTYDLGYGPGDIVDFPPGMGGIGGMWYSIGF